MLIGGTDDVLAPIAAVRRGADLLTGSPHVRFEAAPGGHLGVLTGRRARTTTWTYLDAFLSSTAA
jgi:polyhydroxyalkanoate synthase subunit PhaC